MEVVGGPTLRSYSYMFIAICGWGLSTPFIEFGLPFIAPLPYLASRFILAALVLTPIILLRRWKEFVHLIQNRWTWIIGISEVSGLVLQYLGQDQGVPGGLAALLSLCFLLIVPFLSPFVLGQGIHRLHALAIAVGFVGILFISTEGNLNNLSDGRISLLGVVLLIGAAFSYAMYIVATSRLTTIEEPEVDTFVLFYIILLIIAISSSLSTLLFSQFEPIEGELWIWLVLLAVFSTLVAFFAYFEALREIPANTASVLLLLQVLVPFTIDYALLDRRYGIWVLAGSVLVLIAMLIVVLIPFLERRSGVRARIQPT